MGAWIARMATVSLPTLSLSRNGNIMEVNFTDPNMLKELDDATADKFYDWLKGMLPMGPMTVTFTKADGTERVMNCTLDPKLLPPPEPLKEGRTPRTESKKAIRVFDLDKQEWRSFTIKKVRTIQLTI